MTKLRTWIGSHAIILGFSLAKLLAHLITATHYGLHRDAYLYLAQSQHLDWGYFSTPPLVAFITRIHTLIWGDSLLAVRLLPALIGTLGIFLVGKLIRDLGGRAVAQIIGMTAYLVSPAFLRPALLLQPVVFNHLFWLLAAIVTLRLLKKQDPRQLLWFIPVLGLGWMNKYSMVFYAIALALAVIISPQRKLLWSKYLLIAMAGSLIVILPNLIWQYTHGWPVLAHLGELQESQLGNVLIQDFLLAQVFMHLPALPAWIAGLLILIIHRDFREYRVFAWAFGITILLIILLRGKHYYTIAAYTMLVVFGGLAWERWARRPRFFLIFIVLGLMLLTGISILPFSLPIYTPERMVEYDQKMIERGMEVMLKWEDGEVHDLPQDYADMVGWDELGRKVWDFYDALPDSVRERTWVYGESYGRAGAALYHRPDDSYPEAYSFNDAFMEWIPRTPDFDHLIYMGQNPQLAEYFETVELVDRVEHPYFRESGMPIHFGSYPTPALYEAWDQAWQGSKGRFSR